MGRFAVDVLVHTCCGSCTTIVLPRLMDAGCTPLFFYYNPNIYPEDEYIIRLQTAQDYVSTHDSYFLEGPYDPDEYQEAIGQRIVAPDRCRRCMLLRLDRTAQEAALQGVGCFTTTLLASPYQDLLLVRSIAGQVAQKYRVLFWDDAFVCDYRKSRSIAGQLGMYQQHYCGCEYSLNE